MKIKFCSENFVNNKIYIIVKELVIYIGQIWKRVLNILNKTYFYSKLIGGIYYDQ